MKQVPDDIRENEAAALKALYLKLVPKETSQGEFGKRSGIGTAGMVWQYLNGHRPLNLAAARKFATAMGVPVDDFSPRLAAEARAAAGLSRPDDDVPNDEPLAGEAMVLDDALRHLGKEARSKALAYIRATLDLSEAPHVQEMRARYHTMLEKLGRLPDADDGEQTERHAQ